MKNIIIFISLLSFLTSCSSKMSKTIKNYKFIQTYSFPSTNEHDSLYQHTDSSIVYLLDNMRILKTVYLESSNEFGENVLNATKWHYFGHRVNNKQAFYLKDLKDQKIHLANIDSLYSHWTSAQFLDSAVKKEVANLSSVNLVTSKQQIYSFTMEGFENITLFFDKGLSAIPYSLSPTIDSLFNSKLIGIKLEINKKEFPPNTDDNLRTVEIKLREVALNQNDAEVFFFQKRIDSVYNSKLSIQN